MVLLEVLLLASDVRGARLELQAESGICMPKKDGAKPTSAVALTIEGKFMESAKGDTGTGDMGEGERWDAGITSPLGLLRSKGIFTFGDGFGASPTSPDRICICLRLRRKK